MKKVSRKKRKKKKILKKIFLLLVIILVILFVPSLRNNESIKIKKNNRNGYLASSSDLVILYQKNEENILEEAGSAVRGGEVEIVDKVEIINDIEYYLAVIDDKDYYINKDSFVLKEEDIVLEKVIYDRNATYMLEDVDSGRIVGLARKGDELNVLGFDYVLEDGSVNLYYVKNGDVEGYVYGKYTVYDKEESLKNYNAELLDPIHSSISNFYSGGEAIKLDYYPVEKISFEENKMPESVYALYLNASSSVIDNIDDYIAFARDTKINAFVVDIKDNESPAYPAKVFESISPTNYEHAINSYDNYKNAIDKLKESGFYVIGRITVFKDSYYVNDHPEDAITNVSTGKPYLHTGSYWPSPYDRDVWYYAVSLAREAVVDFGFNEINFDYVRFPDRMQSVSSNVDLLNSYNEDKVEAIQRFVQYATDELHKLDVYVSIDVFGETTNGTYTTAYGQYWPAISNVADVICGMPYPDHFSSGYYGISKPWNEPYKLMSTWARYASDRQKETTTPAFARTWIQAYDVMKYVDSNGISYNAKELEDEIRGLYDGGLTGGYITWLSNSSLEKYKKQVGAFKIDYVKEYLG